MVILPPPTDKNVIDTSCLTRGAGRHYFYNFGSRFGGDGPEAYTDLILPLFDNGQNLVFLNPRASLTDEGQNNLSLGLGLRRMVLPGLVLGGNLYTDSSETRSDNRLSQWGAGLEVLTDWVDFRANFYDASSSKKKNGEYTTAETETRSVTTARTRSRTSANTTASREKKGEQTTSGTHVDYSGGGTGAPSEPYARGNEIWYEQPGGTTATYTPYTRTDSIWETRSDTTYTTRATTTYRTETTHTTTTKLFERFERGMDGWDAELGLRLPWKGPETRLFGGWYDYENPFGEDVEGWKARLELRPGPWLSLDAELYENGRLHGGDWFLGARVSIPLSRDLGWKDFREGLFSLRPRCLEDRMRGEMARREGVRAAESAWGENLAKRQVDTRVEVSERSVTRTSSRTERGEAVTVLEQGQEQTGTPWTVTTGSGPGQTIKLADHITFVDGAHSGTADGTAAKPYNNLQAAADAARDARLNTGEKQTVFVYEPGGRRIDGDKVYIAAGNGGKYEHGVEVYPGITLTSTVSGMGVTYQTENPPLIETTATLRPAYPYNEVYTVVLLRENTTLERMAVTAHGNYNPIAVFVLPTASSTASDQVVIRDSALKAPGDSGDAVLAFVPAGRTLGNLTVDNVTAEASDLYMWTEVDGVMGDLSVNNGRFTGDRGVYTLIEGTMGGMTITGAGKITSGTGYDIERRCRATCQGPLTVDGVKISDGSGAWNNP